MDGGWITALGDDEVDRIGAGELDVGARGVEVSIRRHDGARPGYDAEQDLLRRASLVGRNDMAERPQLGDRGEEAEPRRGAGIRLVAALDAGPLLGAHGTGPRVGQQVDEDVGRVEVE
jgi:hypothetical protein